MCEGADLILEADVVFGGGIAYEWAQFVDDGSGNLTLQPLSSTDDNVIFVDVEASALLDAPTLVEGVANVIYTYGAPPQPISNAWSRSLGASKCCPPCHFLEPFSNPCMRRRRRGAQRDLDAGATTLNGTGITWDWD